MTERETNTDTDSTATSTGTSTSTSTGVSADEILIPRDEQGAIVPEEVFVEEFEDTVVAKPMNKAARRRYLEPIAEAASVAEAISEGEIDADALSEEDQDELENLGLSTEEQAQMFEEHIVEPDLSAAYRKATGGEKEELDAEFLDEYLDPNAENPLFYAILLASGEEEAVESHREALAEQADAEAEADESESEDTGSGEIEGEEE